MKLCGFQKTTLLDYPGHLASVIFTGGCNFRCPFCHNRELLAMDVKAAFTPEEILGVLKKRAGVLEGVCITGGEPLLQEDLEDFIRDIRKLGLEIKLDTNGTLPKKLMKLGEEGLLDYVAMDIKNAPDKYGMTIGIEDYNMDEILRSVDFLLSGTISYEFRTTVVREFHKREDFAAIGRWIKGAERYYLQSFQDSGDLIRPGLRAYTKEILVQALEIIRRNVPNAELRGC